jgi:RNA polymerase sigma-70 factor (ECF subfamily)
MRGFEEIVLPQLENVTAFALALTRSEGDADDLVQTTFLRALEEWPAFPAGTDCRHWLLGICRTAFLESNRPAGTRLEAPEGDAESLPTTLGYLAARRDGTLDRLDRIAARPAIERAVRTLPEPHHSVLVLVDIEGLGYEEAAAVLRVPPEIVRSRLYRARRHVQEAMLAHARDGGIERRMPPRPSGTVTPRGEACPD